MKLRGLQKEEFCCSLTIVSAVADVLRVRTLGTARGAVPSSSRSSCRLKRRLCMCGPWRSPCYALGSLKAAKMDRRNGVKNQMTVNG